MDASSSPVKWSQNLTRGGGASKFLADLPSRGLFSSSTVSSSNLGGMRVYICDHDTSPPEDQMIKTNTMNILIRSLTLKKSKGDSNSKDAKGTSPSEVRKRPAERAVDGRASSKRPLTNALVGSQQEASKSRVPDRDLQNLTVERLRALLKEKGLSFRGKKDELVTRLRGASSQS